MILTIPGKPNLSVEINTPPAVKNSGVNSLPPHKRREAYRVDDYPAAPESWMRGGADSDAFFFSIKEGSGLWLDFNGCADHSHEVAVLISIQGINPVTGQRVDGQKLEQYTSECPVHHSPFGGGRFCKECGFHWPKQNYLATTGTPRGSFWLDGFRTQDGKVRQYVFTAEELKGVAAQILGSERVFAIGVSFFLSKEAKPRLAPSSIRFRSGGFSKEIQWTKSVDPSDLGGILEKGDDYMLGAGPMCGSTNTPPATFGGGILRSMSLQSRCVSPQGLQAFHSPAPDFEESVQELAGAEAASLAPAKKFEIGAGAQIQQEVHDDPKPLSYWEETPAGVIYLHYADGDTVARIVGGGRREKKAEGFLDGITLAD